ncbi:MAG: tetratricopeptide repeat protein [Firmicutes bacterium]|nr:tetratricopeptide repeat protein [Bacillota bacterium]
MKTDILSLKSLYQFLTNNDYPVYSEGIITRKNHRGLTLTKFWQDNILYDFRNRKCGRQIWRSSEGRNRYISDICNRSGRLGCYGEYAEEICHAATQEAVARQIQQFMSVLLERNYHHEVFCQKLPAYIRLIAEWDDSFSEAAQRFFTEALGKEQVFADQGSSGRLFYCGYFLTMLMLHALSGNGEGEGALCRLREDPALSIEALGGFCLKNAAEKSRKEVIWLTGQNNELCSAPLPRQHFFGREKELFELRQMLLAGGKYLISGIGGIGKTELMRQLLRCCDEEALTDYICVIQYEGSLMASFVKAFPQIHGIKAEDNFKEALACIRSHEGERVLIIIDNLGEYEEEELAVLKTLPAVIFITSRYHELKGFTTYPVQIMDRSAGDLIFRDNYEKNLTEKDRQALSEILDADIWRHTLTLRLLGRTAAVRGWTIPEVKKLLDQGILPASMQEQDIYQGLQQMYRRMYADLGTKKINGLLQTFAVLPYQSYTAEFAEKFFAGFMDEEQSIEEELEKLYIAGRLEKHPNGYSMHPFMAECVRNNGGGVREKDIGPFLDALAAAWGDREKGPDTESVENLLLEWGRACEGLDQALLAATQLLPSLVLKLTGRCSRKLSGLVLAAFAIRCNTLGSPGIEAEQLEAVKKKLGRLDEEEKLVLCVLQCMDGGGNPEKLEKECAALLESPGVGRRGKFLLIGQQGLMFFRKGSLEKVEQAANVLEEYQGEEHAKEISCFLHTVMAQQQGDLESYEKWLLEGYEAAKTEGHEKGAVMMDTLSALADLYYATRQFERAEQFLQELEENFADQPGVNVRMMLSFYRGGLALFKEEEGFGIQQLEEACRLAKNFWSGVDDGAYATFLTNLAMAYNKAGRREESAESYQQAIALLENKPGYEYDRSRTINNMSVMYLDWGKPKEALHWLEKVRPFVCGTGGPGLAESSYNLSRAWRQLGDREKELQYLKEAAPLLEQYYGSVHPKVADVRKRLRDVQ